MQINRLVIFTVVILIAFSAPINAANAVHVSGSDVTPEARWQRYLVSGEEFSVELPVRPAMNTLSWPIDENSSRRERVIGAYAEGVVYAVYTFEKKRLTADELFKRFFEEQKPADFKVDNLAGKVVRNEDQDWVMFAACFETARNFYVFQAVGTKLVETESGIGRFASSISFRNLKGLELVDGPGEQSGEAATEILSGRVVTQRAKVITKPQPSYTDAARMKQISGTVVLRVVFSSTGTVTNIQPISGLPEGLTEKTIDVARQIRFIPAVKNGRFVSMWMQLEYNFNLY